MVAVLLLSTPLLAVPPSSCNWKLKLGVPVLAGAVYVNWPMLPAAMVSGAVTAVPLNFSVPLAGVVRMITFARWFAGVSFGSPMTKSAALNVRVVFCGTFTVALVAVGASLTLVTFTWITFGVGSR